MTVVAYFAVLMSAALLALATWKAPRLSSVILWALVTTIFVGAALILVVPGALEQKVSFNDKLYWLTVLAPLIWGALLFWAYWEKRAWLVPTVMLGLCFVSGAVVFVFNPMVTA